MPSNDRSGPILGVAISFLVLTMTSTMLRVFTRIRILGNQFGHDDIAMVGAMAVFLAYLICQLNGIAHGTGKKRELLTDENAQTALMFWSVYLATIPSLKPPKLTLKSRFFCEIFYTLATCILKLSIGLFLLRIAAVPTHIWIIRLVMIFNVIFAIPYCLLVLFQCKPISFWWDLEPGHTGQCLSPKVMVIMSYTISALNSGADWIFGLLPILIVKNLQMKRQTKVLVASILGFAALGSTATLIRTPFIHTMTHYKGEFLWKTSDVAIWTTIEIGVGATAANIATMRPLLQRILKHFRIGLTSTGVSRPFPTFSNSRSRSKHSQWPSGRLDMDLLTMDELRAGGADAGKTEVRIQGGVGGSEKSMPTMRGQESNGDSFDLTVPGRDWKQGIVQSVEIRTESESREGECGSQGVVSDVEGGRAVAPYERL